MKEGSLLSRFGLSLRSWGLLVVLGLAGTLTGCTGFFVPVDNGGGSSGGGSTTAGADRAYVGNAATNTLSGFLVGSGKLSTLNTMPYALGFSPTAMVVHPNNNFLYVAGAGAIYVLPLNSDGSITISISQAGTAIVTTTAMDVSPDGNWLFALDSVYQQVYEYQINKTTGALSLMGTIPYTVTGATVRTASIKVSPDGGLVVAALGAAGDVMFTLNTASGALVNVRQILPFTTLTADNAAVVDSTNSYLYIARTGVGAGLEVYAIGSGYTLTAVAGSPFTAGTQPLGVVLDATGKYVYVANGSGGNISGFAIGTGGVLTPLAGSPYTSGAQVGAIGRDNSGSYILTAAYGGSPDVTLYSFDTTSPGKLDTATTAQTGTAANPASANTIALTH